MLTLFLSASLALALNAGPEPKPYGPVIDSQTMPQRIPSRSEMLVPETPAPTTVAPGTVRPASYARKIHANDRTGRNYTCVDDACDRVAPVFNTRSPIEAETAPFTR